VRAAPETLDLAADEAAHPAGEVAHLSAGTRLGLRGLDYAIPSGALRWPYFLGGLTAFFLLLLIVTGIYLAQFYNPTASGAHDSVLYIITRAPFGDWVRSLHYWATGGVVLTVTAHLLLVFVRRGYRRPRELTWWAGVAMAAVLFLFIVTGTALRSDQEGVEALAHFVAGGRVSGWLGQFFTPDFTLSVPLLPRIFSLHVSLLPLALVALTLAHFWLIRHLGIHARGERMTTFRRHALRLTGVGLLGWAAVGVLAAVVPAGLGYPGVAGVEITKPMWPVLWVYGLENLLGVRGMVVGPLALLAFLILVPLFDRRDDSDPRGAGWVDGTGAALLLALIVLWLYGTLGAAREHIGM
jgi:ubiquinol-cytochrome c reductase cytochrome b subunit